MIRPWLRVALVAAPLLACPLAPAAAQYVVYDPSNYAQNLLQATRALQQVTNQITSLQNEAQMLINQARNLASLPYSSLGALQQSAQRTQQLLGQAQKISYDVGAIDRAFQGQYGSVSLSSSDAALVTQAKSRWETTVAGLQDALRVQAGVVGNLDSGRSQASTLVGQSQAATGSLQAMQAGNQLQALQAQQLSDLTAVVAANGRAQALSEAERATAVSEGQERYRRFSTPSSYQPSAVTMFRGN